MSFINTEWDIWDRPDDIDINITKSLVAITEEVFQPVVGSTLTFRDQAAVRINGYYFPPKGRVFYTDTIDRINDGLPDIATLTGVHDYFGIQPTGSALSNFTVIKIKNPPPRQKRKKDFEIFKVIMHEYFEDGLPDRSPWTGQKMIYSDGVRQDTSTWTLCGYVYVHKSKDIVAPILDKHKGLRLYYNERFIKKWFCIAVSAFQDRRYLWNVVLKYNEGGLDNIVRFGVDEERVKSLFYSRSSPILESGRKRPIQHWVSSHKRRIKAGIDIDVKQHLRGIAKFEMMGYFFEITSPCRLEHNEFEKKQKERADFIIDAPTQLPRCEDPARQMQA